jgi:hypothetical protein
MTEQRTIFVLRLRPEPGVDAARALKAALKVLLRRCGMRAVSVEEEKTMKLLDHRFGRPGSYTKSSRASARRSNLSLAPTATGE